MTKHSLLDRPVWNTLSTVHSKYATGSNLAKRFNADISPFAATINDTPESLAELVRLIPDNGSVMLMQTDELVCPLNGKFIQQGLGVQMLLNSAKLQAESRCDYLDLGTEDADEIYALAELTKPGPFLPKTHRLGEFIGIRIDGKLIAMAGERFRQPGYTEISGVCTHPDFRGRGLAAQLIVVMARRILNRHEAPYLHAFASNTGAIELYKRLGFEHRANVNVAVLERTRSEIFCNSRTAT